MSRVIEVTIETSLLETSKTIHVEVDEEASPNDIDEIASDVFHEHCNYGWREVTDAETTK